MLRLIQGISSGCLHATPTQFFPELSLLWAGCLILLRLTQGISIGCHHAKLTPLFGIVIIGRVACFCFDLEKVFLQDATTPPLHFFWELSSFWEVDFMCLLRLSKGISSGCHHDIPTQFFGLSLFWEVGIMFASTQPRYFFMVPLRHTYTIF